jgi:hypothetical protein
MSLNTGGPVNFKPRPIEGTPNEARQVVPHFLEILQGDCRQQDLIRVRWLSPSIF